jgi:lipopolysaccharide biosynthesis regulator YciM
VSKALAVAPDNPDVRIEQARLLIRQGSNAEAIRLFDGLAGLDRQQTFDGAQILANAYMRLGRIDEARQAAKIVAAYAEEGAQAAFASRLARSIEDYAGQRVTFELRAGAFETKPGDSGADSADDQALRPPSVPNVAAGAVSSVTITGRLRNVDCQNGEFVLEVLSASRTVRLFIDDRNAITVLGKGGSQVDLKCGPKDAAVTVGYEPGTDARRGTVGYVRLLDYR